MSVIDDTQVSEVAFILFTKDTIPKPVSAHDSRSTISDGTERRVTGLGGRTASKRCLWMSEVTQDRHVTEAG